MDHLLQSPRIKSLEEGTFLDTTGWGDVGCSEILLSQNLNQVQPRRMLFEVVVGQDFQLILESHLQGPVSSGLKNRNMVKRGLERCEQSNQSTGIKPGTV